MPRKYKRASRKKVGEEVVSVLVKQAVKAGATLEQLASETGRPPDELERLLDKIDYLEQLERMLRE